MIRLILNLLWFFLGGWLAGLLWLLGGLLLAITIVGLPYTGAAWRIAGFAFWPFGKDVVSRAAISGEDVGTGPLGFLLNVVWFVLGGWYIALAHLMIAVAEFISIIGIPFALKDLQLARIAFAPIGTAVVRK
ncbi:YccF domain-containing protein [Caulobacter sp. 73W]|uniref:Inner membrane protein YccF n=1 Tax=Caulobacter sp. 73W TaxID=3161137 RepID=A0AB39KQD2_9CAUL